MQPITYKSRRMEYHPEFHPRQGKPFTVPDMIYIAKFYHHDHCRSIAFALGRTERAVEQYARRLMKSGLYWKYKKLSLDEWASLDTGADYL